MLQRSRYTTDVILRSSLQVSGFRYLTFCDYRFKFIANLLPKADYRQVASIQAKLSMLFAVTECSVPHR